MFQQCHLKGAASELRVAEWFVRQGCQVYWPTIQQGGIDLVVDIAGELTRVQVKSATWATAGRGRYLQCKMPIERTRERLHDLLAIVNDEELWLIPSSKVESSNISLRHNRVKGAPNKWEAYHGSFSDSLTDFFKRALT